MKRKNICLFSAVFTLLLGVSLSIVIPLNSVSAETTPTSNKLDITITLALSNAGKPEKTDYSATWSYGDYSAQLYSIDGPYVVKAKCAINDDSYLTISMPKTCSTVFLETPEQYLEEHLSCIGFSKNTTKKLSTTEPYGIEITRNDDSDIVLESIANGAIFFTKLKFMVGTLETSKPVEGWTNENGKKALVAFGFTYVGPTLSLDSDYGISVSTDNETFTDLSNGTLSDLATNEGRFYCYKTDSSPTKYYAKGFIKLNGETFYTTVLEATGSLTGSEYTINK